MRKIYILIIGLLLIPVALWSQQESNFVFRDNHGKAVYLPLGKISFADKVHSFHLGFPRPLTIFRDSTQSLGTPDYVDYRQPDFVSIGCGGQLILTFNDNGFMNLKGDDLYIFEVGPSREGVRVEISMDGERWHYAGATSGGKSMINFSDFRIPADQIYYYVRLTDLKDECTGRTAGADIDAVAAINSVIKLTLNADVLFDVDSTYLKEASQATLDSISSLLKGVRSATILVEGHTDSDGEAQYNYDLSYNRCYSVVQKLKALLIDDSPFAFEIKALGELSPRVPNDTEGNKQLNRRVEITVLPPGTYYENIRE
ncbi:OmpA family protein [Altibacter sp. HG106]|uniref:OmpA family protein n=1 Tax=Altibacter sp. HG106 TaxID=3023937 RepID=UPI002350C0E1|nr:OmpA family protein [Altibacter sp. HG106]MDC7996305.1 OmpA family protein [Altibacter sp. HG106]